MRTFSIGSIILAAGKSTRMGFPKLMLRAGKQTFLEKIMDAHHQITDEICIVVGDQPDEVFTKLSADGFIVRRNPSPEMGPLSSIQIGLAALDGVSAVIIHPVDHPEVSPETISRLKKGHLSQPACLLIPCFAGKRGHPVLFPSKFFPDLRKAPLDIGARYVVHKNPGSTMLVGVNDPGILINVNTPSDYEKLMRC